MHVWALWLSCETRRPHQTEPPGLAHDNQRTPKRAHLSVPALQTPPKFHEKTPREGRKERILWREREKKARNFVPPTLRAPTPSGRHFFFWVWAPTLRAPTFSRAPTLRGPALRGPTLRGPTLRAPWVWPLVCLKKTNN